MRAAGAKLKELYSTQLGQDILETLIGAGIASGGQLLFTDMSPQEIAMSTGLGIGAAAVGRPLVGRAGQFMGKRLDNNPSARKIAEDMIDINNVPEGILRESLRTKLAPYVDLPATAQVGQILGRGYGDNIMQGIVGLTSPLFMGGNEDA